MPKKDCPELFTEFAEYTINNYGKPADGKPFNLSHLREELETWQEDEDDDDPPWSADDLSEIEDELDLIEMEDSEATLMDFVSDGFVPDDRP